MSEALKTPEAPVEEQPSTESPQVEKKTPGKRTRLSFIERAQKESEELVKNLGGSLEMEGGRRTRSSARGTPTRPVATPPPAKKSRNSPASPKAATPRGRGRGRKLDTPVTPEPPESKGKVEGVAGKTEENEAPSEENQEAEPKKSPTVADKPAEAAKTNVISETNGPEKPETELVSDKPKKVEESDGVEKEAPVEDKPVAATEDDKPAADQVDATKSETVQEKTSQPATAELEKAEEKLNEPVAAESAVISIADSPMEVDEQSNPASSNANEEAVASVPEAKKSELAKTAAEKPASAAVVETVAEKDPTPEPMEVDSSSKSSDVIECTDVVDKVNETASSAQSNNSNDVKSSTNSHAPSAENPPAVEAAAEVPTAPAAENNLKAEINANVTANDKPAVKSIEEPIAAGEPHIDNNKNENDLDQQKLAASSAGDTPVNAIPTSL